MNVIAKIDISSPTGRKIVRELEKHKKVVKITYPETNEIPLDAVSIEFGIEEFWGHLEKKFGFDLRTYEEN
ncbi:MAG TPA: hypothetical protein P5084_14090 [Paludibacter sp.]|nr:hypothetical protein [Paludibacter sp.]